MPTQHLDISPTGNDSDRKFLLIGGTGRSGTTILCRIMGSHPQLTDVPEWRFMTDPDGVIDFARMSNLGNDSPFHFDKRVKRLEKLLNDVARRRPLGAVLGSARLRKLASDFLGRNLAPSFARTNAIECSPNFSKLAEDLLATLCHDRFDGYWVGMEPFEKAKIALPLDGRRNALNACADFLRAVADDVCNHQNARYHLEKNTWNTLWFDRTLDVLPEAKLVHIYRDPRDVVSSYSVQPWVPNDHILSARVYQQLMNQWWDVRSRLPEESYLELSLEQLTTNPRTGLEQICNFWGIEWDAALDNHGLKSSSFGRWRQDIDASVIEQVTDIVRPSMDAYGYAE